MTPFGGRSVLANPTASAVHKEGADFTIAFVFEFPSLAKALEWEGSDACEHSLLTYHGPLRMM